jgi:hypothetical protein
LETVNIGNSLTNIGISAFENCSKLTSIVFPNTLLCIDDFAFKNSGLTSFNLPSDLTKIGTDAFSSDIVRIMNSITVPDGSSINSNAFYNIYTLSLTYNGMSLGSPWGAVICDQITADGLCITNNTIVKYIGTSPTVTIPNTVTAIGTNAFSNSPIASLVIPDTVTTIEANAFSYARNLKQLTLPANLTTIPSNMCSYSGLDSITIPDSVESIGN